MEFLHFRLFVLAFLVVVPARSATICGLLLCILFSDERLENDKLYVTTMKKRAVCERPLFYAVWGLCFPSRFGRANKVPYFCRS